MKEQDVYNQLSQWLKLQHPNLIWRWDFAAGQKMSVGMAMRMKKMQCGVAYPDFFLAKPSSLHHGLYIEIKVDGFDLYQKRDKTKYLNEHIEAQAECLNRLNFYGYYAVWGIGFDNCKRIIETYLKL